MRLNLLLTSVALLAGAMTAGPAEAQDAKATVLVHSRTEFTFVAKASYEQVFPLFGAWEEKKWAEEWDPQFVYPATPGDQPGMVFTVTHGGVKSLWTNTAFDAASGHVQYVYVIPDALVTVVDIHLTKGATTNETKVSVVYERTALTADANAHVGHLAKRDAESRSEWEGAINGYLQKAAGK